MDTVTITREEHQRLIQAEQDLADIQLLNKARDTAEEGLPHAFMARLIEGDAPLAVYRSWRGLSQAALSRESGVNRVQIVNIESGKKQGSVETLKKLADALDIMVDDLLD